MERGIDVDCFICETPLTENQSLYSFSINRESIDRNVATVDYSEGRLLACQKCNETHHLQDTIENSLSQYIFKNHTCRADSDKIKAISSKFNCSICHCRIPDQTPYIMPTHSIESWKHDVVSPIEVTYGKTICPACERAMNFTNATRRIIDDLLPKLKHRNLRIVE